MPHEFITMIIVFCVSMLFMISIVSGIDASFELSKEKLYSLMFKLNILLIVFSLVFVGLFIYLGSLFHDLLSPINDTVQMSLFFITIAITIFAFKYWLFIHNGLVYKNYTLIVLFDMFLLTAPPYIVSKMLEAFGKAFQH